MGVWKADGTPLWAVQEPPYKLAELAFSSDDSTLAVATRKCITSGNSSTDCSSGGWLRLYKVADGSIIHELEKDHANEYLSLAFSPDGTMLASHDESSGRNLRLWNVSDGQVLHTLQADSPDSLAFSPDGQLIALVRYDSTEVWRIQTEELLFTSSMTHEPCCTTRTSVSFSPDGQILATEEENKVWLWRIPDGGLIRTLDNSDDGAASLAFSPDGQTLAVQLHKDYTISNGKIWLWSVP